MFNRAIPRRTFMKAGGSGLLALSLGPKFLVPEAKAQTAAEPKAELGYTFCDGCNHVPFCGIQFHHQDGLITNVEPWEGYPAAPICSKGYATMQRLYNPKRLKYPMKRTNPKGSSDPGFVRISWDEAYDSIIKQINRIKEQYGPHSVFFYAGDPKEPRAAIQRLAAVYGSVNYGCESSTTCRRSAMLAEFLTYGFGTMGNLPSEETKVMLVWGTNPAYSGQPHMCHGKLMDAKERGVKFIVVDPRITPTVSTLADIHLQVRPGCTAALAAGLMHVIFKENLEDKEFCANYIHGIEELKAYVADFDPKKVEKITDVPAQLIINAARLYASNAPGGLMTNAQATTHDLNACNNHRGLLMVPAVCGYIDVPGGITKPTNPLEGMAGPWANGPPKFSMRKQRLAWSEHRLDAKYYPVWAEKIWEIQGNHIVESINEGKLKAFLGWGLNLMIWPQSHEYMEAFDKLEFTMAVDYFYRPWTHSHVDVLLPAAMNYERLAPFAVFGRTVYARTPLKPQGECREDWQIALELGTRLGHGKTCFNGNPEAACNEILKMWNLNYDDLRMALPKGVTVPAKKPEAFEKHKKGVKFGTSTGKIEAVSEVLKKHGYPALPEYKETMPTSEEYPLILVSGSRVPYITHSKWRKDSPWLLELQSEPVLTLHPKDAAARGIDRGDRISLKTQWGQIEVVAKPTVLMKEGVVGMMHGWAKANINELIPRQFDPISGYPPFKNTPCQVVKA